eukprot:CAMPEP_0177637080 /NCGR_PEP_ID=MMETSP0447-20121125/4782_1 /TAXON_ID=0 /ORGANISM="Stygamoeba regulata, Strain BSH-02190019" /LENGTH=612 /DNA_ID=CAMNT_0019138987 /DNA_START=139 /DNA_END=1974 /DNA_ORIENTATION=+
MRALLFLAAVLAVAVAAPAPSHPMLSFLPDSATQDLVAANVPEVFTGTPTASPDSIVDWVKALYEKIKEVAEELAIDGEKAFHDIIKHWEEIKNLHQFTPKQREMALFAVSSWNETHAANPVEVLTLISADLGRFDANLTHVEVFVEQTRSPNAQFIISADVRDSEEGYVLEWIRMDTNQTWPCDAESADAGCTCMKNGHCARGSLRPDPWTTKALAFQRALQQDEPLYMNMVLQSHNAFNTRADGYGADDDLWGKLLTIIKPDLEIVIANQEFSLTDQLRMGVRSLELDLHWFNGKIRMCHSHGPSSKIVTDIVHLVGLILHRDIDWDLRNIGCGPWDRPFELAVVELAEWFKLPENKDEVVVFYFEDHSYFTWGHDDLVNGPIEAHWGDLVLTPGDLKHIWGGEWPTPRSMLEHGKRIVIASASDGTHAHKFIHTTFWHENGIDRLTPFPECGKRDPTSWFRYYGDKLCYPPIMNDCDPSGWNTPERMRMAADCNTKFIGSDYSNLPLMKAAVWSWADGEPKHSGESGCTAVGPDGWVTLPCTTPMRVACQAPSPASPLLRIFTLADALMTWTDAHTSHACGSSNATFGLPVNGRESAAVRALAPGEHVW